MFQGRKWTFIRNVLLVFACITLCSCTFHASPRSQTYVSRKAQGIIAGSAAGVGIGHFIGGEIFPLTGAVGGIFAGAVGDYLARHQSLTDHLAANSVLLFQVGDEYRLVLPVDRFFYPNSTRLNPGYYALLNDIATFLVALDKIDVEIAGYTDCTKPLWEQRAISRAQAESMMKYLWRKGIDTRLLYATGYGGADPVASNWSTEGQALNRRVEIRFRVLSA